MKNNLLLLWRFLEGKRISYLLATCAVILASWFEIQTPRILGFTLDTVIGGKEADSVGWLITIYEHVGERLYLFALLLAAVSLLGGLFLFVKGRLTAIAAEGAAERTRLRLYAHIHRLPFGTLNSIDTGDLIQRATSDVETARSFFATQFSEVGRTIFLVMLAVAAMLGISPRMTLVSLSLVPAIFLFAYIYFLRIEEVFERADEAEGRLSHTAQEHLSGVRVVKAFRRQQEELAKFDRRNREHRDESVKVIRLLAGYWSFSETMSLLQIAMVLFFGVRWAAAGSISVGTLVVFFSYTALLLWPIRQLGRILSEMGKALVALKRIEAIFEMQGEIETGSRRTPIKGGVELRGVSLRYDDKSEVLQDINLKIRPGETVAILGKTGSGKSSLVQLLGRLYEPSCGEILLDGIPIQEFDLTWLRSQVGIILQEPFLYRRSLKENVILAEPHLPEPRLEEAARQAALHTVVREFEKGWDTPVGEGGVTLSGGQKQRVAIARMLVRDQPLLIFDDSLSAVDASTDARIRRALKRRHDSRTTILISHRISTLMEAERILVMDRGRIVQQGDHATLLGRQGLYRRIWNLQSSLEEQMREAGDASA